MSSFSSQFKCSFSPSSSSPFSVSNSRTVLHSSSPSVRPSALLEARSLEVGGVDGRREVTNSPLSPPPGRSTQSASFPLSFFLSPFFFLPDSPAPPPSPSSAETERASERPANVEFCRGYFGRSVFFCSSSSSPPPPPLLPLSPLLICFSLAPVFFCAETFDPQREIICFPHFIRGNVCSLSFSPLGRVSGRGRGVERVERLDVAAAHGHLNLLTEERQAIIRRPLSPRRLTAFQAILLMCDGRTSRQHRGSLEKSNDLKSEA